MGSSNTLRFSTSSCSGGGNTNTSTNTLSTSLWLTTVLAASPSPPTQESRRTDNVDHITGHHRDSILFLDGTRHVCCHPTGDVSSLKTHECARGLLKSVAEWPLVIEASAPGIGGMQLKLFNSSPKGLCFWHYEVFGWLETSKFRIQKEEAEEMNQKLFQHIVGKPLSDNDLDIVKRQLRRPLDRDELLDNIQSLLEVLLVENPWTDNQW